MITGAYTVFEANAQYNHEYLHYLYYFLDKHKMMKSLYRGLRNTIPKDSFFSFKTITLPIKEQQAIVSFLDDKTVQIDESIAGQQKIIKKLLEYKASLINSAVTGKIKII
jgi:type I restriction enzyme S subunit